MKSRFFSQGAVFIALLACIVIVGSCSGASIHLSMTPIPISRGESITFVVVVSNSMEDALADTTLFAPLPVGVDQWAAMVRIDGGAWEPYPANGLIALPPVPADGQFTVDIETPVESGSPGALTMTAQWLNATGILAEATDRGNVLPSVDAGPDAIANLGDSIALADSSANDGGGVIASVHWTDYGAGGSFNDVDALNPVYTPPNTSGVVELCLTVTDGDGDHASDSLRLRVNAVPVISLEGQLQASEGSRVTIAHASALDSDGWISSLAWSDGGAGGTFLPSNDVIDPVYVAPVIEGCEDQILTLSLIGTDDLGTTGTDSINLLVINVNQLPTVTVSQDQQAHGGQQVELSAIATDQDGWIDSQQWKQTSGCDVAVVGVSTRDHITLDIPDVTETEDVVFRFTATDNCEEQGWGEVTLTIYPEQVVPPSPAPDTGELRVNLDLFDERGLPLSPFDTPPNGESLTAKLTVSNTGTSRLINLTAHLSGGDPFGLLSSTLDPWRSTTGMQEWQQTIWSGLEIQVVAQATDEAGRPISATDTFRFFEASSGDGPAIILESTPSVTQAALDESFIYTFRVVNHGTSPLSGLSLDNELLGRIDMPSGDLMKGDFAEIHVPYKVRESDLPGPLTSYTTATAFTPDGLKVEANASSLVVLADVGANGGGGDTASNPQQDTVVISEVAWAGSLSNPAAEWIELANIGIEAVDLSGWVLAWHEKGDVLPPPSSWHSIELSGWIQPLETAARGQDDLSFTPLDNGLWSVQDRTWQKPSAGSGYTLLERGNDAVVASTQAGVVYGDAANPYFELPDRGATLWLLNATGEVVDSANAQYINRTGWPAGSLITCATMERIHLDQGDYDENWQSSSGVMTYGQDASGRRLLATAGMANSLPLDLVIDAATATLPGLLPSTSISVPIPSPVGASSPTIQVSTLAVGGGGSVAASAPSISTTRQDGALTMTVDLSQAVQGSYFVWITHENGDTLLLPLAK